MKFRSTQVLLVLLGLPGALWGHGVALTGEQRESVSMPRSFWETFFPHAYGELTVTVKESEGYRYLKSNGIADHATGQFPGPGNPHSIVPKDVTFRVPLNPGKTGRIRQVGHADFGVAVNGIPFDAATAEFWGRRRGGEWNYEAIGGGLNLGLDQNNAHVQPDGTYHYHGLPHGLLDKFDYRNKPAMIGYAADGFPVYSPYGYRDADDAGSGMKELKGSYRIKSGTRPSGPGGEYDGKFSKDWEYVKGLGDLDECNGRSGVMPEYPQGTYYYVITDTYPFIPRCWVGNADDSFQKFPGKQPGSSGGQNRGGFSRGPGGMGGGMMQQGPGGMGGGMMQQGPGGMWDGMMQQGPGGMSGGMMQQGPGGMGGGMMQQGPGGMGGAMMQQGPGGQRQPPQGALDSCKDKQANEQCEFTGRHGKISGVCRNISSGETVCVPAGGPPGMR